MAQDPAIAAFRFGFGPRGGALPSLAPADQLRRSDQAILRYPGVGTAEILAAHVETRARVREVTPGTPAAREVRQAAAAVSAARMLGQFRAELARAIDADDSYRERLVRFWADHFTVRSRTPQHRPLPTAFVDEAIRPNLTGPFSQMLRAATLHPAMLLYLDQSGSVGPDSAFGKRRGAGLNENLARELLELHTLGVGGRYDQNDVRQLAKLLTGIGISREEAVLFDPRRAQPGAETVLGRSYGSDRPARIEDIWAVLDDLAVHPDTAQHMARKLAVHFVSDAPDPGLVADLARVWTRSGADLGAVSAALADHPAAQSPVLEKARQPFDFIVAAARALEFGGAEIMALDDRELRRTFFQPMILMGQRWQSPPGPDGWSEDLVHWITPQGLAARIDWAMRMPGRLRNDLPDPRQFTQQALAGLAGPELRQLVAGAERKAEGIGLVLASPLFNRR